MWCRLYLRVQSVMQLALINSPSIEFLEEIVLKLKCLKKWRYRPLTECSKGTTEPYLRTDRQVVASHSLWRVLASTTPN